MTGIAARKADRNGLNMDSEIADARGAVKV
ncbi:hypothetical protein C100_18525 [Sphingobium sp. C100]|jgi:hypothetical protein|nr:hypothetical protein C100_18525 [Sphingobium sp. C100]